MPGPWKALTLVDTAAELAVEKPLLQRLIQAFRKADYLTVHAVADGHAGLLFVDGVYRRRCRRASTGSGTRQR